MAKVAQMPDGCWIWQGTRGSQGYGQFYFRGRKTGAHRFSYEAHVGPITAPVLDHLCRQPSCVNFAHLEPVTKSVNALRGDMRTNNGNRRKDACPQGHPYDAANTYHDKRGRQCRTCHRTRNREWMRLNGRRRAS